MLLGEHSVVYGHPCIVTAVDQRLFLTITLNDKRSILTIDAPDVGIERYEKSLDELGKGDIPKGAKFVEIAVRNFLSLQGVPLQEGFGLYINTKSDFSSQFGFGSSSASTVCVVKALSELFDLNLSDREIFDLSYKTILDIQGTGSGFDIAAAIYGGTLYFVTGGKTISPLSISRLPRSNRGLPIVVGYSGIKADTVSMINVVSEKAKNDPKAVEKIYNSMASIVARAKEALEKNEWEHVGQLMNENQQLLSDLGVSTAKLDAMITAARSAGAYGAKLSGAGGGDCMIALSAEGKEQSVKNAIENVGGEIIEVKTNAEGARVEN